MPTYQYQCANGHPFERFQRMSDKPKGKCPTCGAPAGRVISGGAGLIFKGSGFYITDYGKDGKGPRKTPDSGSDPGASSKPEGPPESKPAEASPPKPAAETKESKPEKKPKKESS